MINLDGKVVGINTAIVGAMGNIGIGLAIPSNMAKDVYTQIIDGGTVVRGYLGVIFASVTPEIAEYFDLENARGIIINEILEDSPAEKAGLEQGDIILELDGKEIEKNDEFRKQVAKFKPGTKVKVLVLRDGKQKTLTVELGKREAPDKLVMAKSETLEQLGITVENLTAELAQRFDYKGLKGVIVTDVAPGSLAAEKGIRTGTLITEVNQQPISNTKEFNKAIKDAAKKKSILLLVKDKNHSRHIVIELPEK